MEMGTGLGVVGLQFSGQLSLEKVQQAAKELGSRFPLLLARVVGQGKTGGPLELHLCRDAKPITVVSRSIDDVAAWEAAAPLDNDPSSLENGEESDVPKKDQESDAYGDACGEGEKSTSAMEAEFKKLSAADVAVERGVEEEEEEDEFEDAEDGDGDGDGDDDDGGGDGDGKSDGDGGNGGGEFLEASATEGSGGIKVTGRFKGADKAEDLHRIVEMELNQPITGAHGEAPADALQVASKGLLSGTGLPSSVRYPSLPSSVRYPSLPSSVRYPSLPSSVRYPSLPSSVRYPSLPSSVRYPSLPSSVRYPSLPSSVRYPSLPSSVRYPSLPSSVRYPSLPSSVRYPSLPSSVRYPSLPSSVRYPSLPSSVRYPSLPSSVRYPSLPSSVRYPSLPSSVRYPSLPSSVRYPSLPSSVRYPSLPSSVRYPSLPFSVRYPSLPSSVRYPSLPLCLLIRLVHKTQYLDTRVPSSPIPQIHVYHLPQSHRSTCTISHAPPVSLCAAIAPCWTAQLFASWQQLSFPPCTTLNLQSPLIPQGTSHSLHSLLDRPAVRQLAMAFVPALHHSLPANLWARLSRIQEPSLSHLPSTRSSPSPLEPYLSKGLFQAYDALAYVCSCLRVQLLPNTSLNELPCHPTTFPPTPSVFLFPCRDSEAVPLPPPLSSLIPKPTETRSYLSKGLSQAYDALAYVRNSMASSHAPFQPGRADSRKNEFRSSFSCLHLDKQETESLLAALASRSCSLFSLECAAALKAVADAKQLGSRTETFNVTSIMNCRPLLDPPLPPDTMGVFTSGLPLKQPANQDLELWDVARTVDADLATAVGQKKHFIDMPVLELLFSTAMKTPTLSPECSLRTSFMSAITESPFPMDWPANEGQGHVDGVVGGGNEGLAPQLEGFVGPIFATHGVGPSISVGDALCDGELHIYINFVSPLFSQEFIAGFVKLFQRYFEEAMR
ncbi:unnamed protein product [Closterium sp. NIES-65]|nr:unnamed protein product [Closterium sp. NIES-65]